LTTTIFLAVIVEIANATVPYKSWHQGVSFHHYFGTVPE
jgi:hypothetical protein